MAAIVLTAATPLFAQQLLRDMWLPNGKVNALEVDAATGIEYFGGDFSYVGPDRSFGAALGLSDSGINMAVPSPNGRVQSVAPDGHGGWYIGGKFTSVNGQTRNRMARINADGSLHPFNPNFSSLFTEVLAIAVHGDTVFAGGTFDFVNSAVRQNFVALNANGGTTLGMTFNTDNDVLSLAVLDNVLYMGGRFSEVGTSTRNSCAAITISTGTLAGWNPNANGRVKAIVAQPDGVYLAGLFTQIGGIARQRLAKVSPTTGAVLDWDPFISGYACNAMALSGSTLFVAGEFTSIGGEFRTDLAAVDVNTGTPTTWEPECTGTVASLAISGGTVVLGGDFSAMNGQLRWHIATVDTNMGATLGFAPVTDGGTIEAVGIQADQVYAGGQFTSIGGFLRGNAAAIELASGRATAWDPQANAEVFSLVLRGPEIYLGGAFDELGGTPQIGLGAMDISGALLPWAAQPNGPVRTIVMDNNMLYVGGEFTEVAGQVRGKVARFDLTNGSLMPWAPALDNTVFAIEPHGATVYLGGDLTTVNGDTRNRLAAVNTTTGATESWNPDAPNTVFSISATDDAVYVGGAFNGTIGGQFRSKVAKIDPTTGLATAWAPSPNGIVYVIRAEGDSVLMGGTFTTVASATRYGLAVTNSTTGAARPFALDPSFGLFDFAASPGYFHLGGDFSYVFGPSGAGGTPRKYLASVVLNSIQSPTVNTTICPGAALTVAFTANGTFQTNNVFTAELSAAGGSFAAPVIIGSLASTTGGNIPATLPIQTPPGANYRVRVRSSNPPMVGILSNTFTVETLLTWYADADGDGDGDPAVDSLSCSTPNGFVADNSDCDDNDGDYFIGAACDDGDAFTENDVVGMDCACVGIPVGPILAEHFWGTDGPVHAIVQDTVANRIYIGGEFTVVGPNEPYGSLLDATTAEVSTSFPNPDGAVHAVVGDGNGGWYIGGEFEYVGAVARPNLAHILADGTVDTWDPACNGLVRTLLLDGNTLYVGGDFNGLSGQSRLRGGAFNVNTGALLTWNPNATGAYPRIYDFAVDATRVFVAGSFNNIGGQPRNYLAALNKTNGAASTWNPDPSDYVYALAINGTTIYVGGAFTQVGAQPRARLASLSMTTGFALAWNPGISNGIGGLEVNDMLIEGDTVFIGGNFGNAGGLTRKNLAAIALGNGQSFSGWTANTNGTVNTLTKAGATLFVGGAFTTSSGQARARLSAINSTNGTAQNWVADATGDVLAIGEQNGQLFVGGEHTLIGTVPRSNIAVLDAVLGNALSWSPGANGMVRALVLDGDHILAGGEFTGIGFSTRQHLAALNLTTGGALAGWDPNVNGTVRALLLGNPGVYVGGDFSTVDGQPRSHIAELQRSTGNLLSWAPTIATPVHALIMVGDTVCAGYGMYTSSNPTGGVAGIPQNNAAGLYTIAGTNERVYSLEHYNGTLYIGGRFTTVNGNDRRYLAAKTLVQFSSVSPWNPQLAGGGVGSEPGVMAMGRTGNLLHVLGDYSTIGGVSSGSVCSIPLPGVTRTNWTPAPYNGINSPEVRAVAISRERFCFGGKFIQLYPQFVTPGIPRSNFAVFGMADCEGVASGGALPGQPCDDGNASTGNDVWTNTCTCVGEVITAIAQVQNPSGLRAWPNPTAGTLNLNAVVSGTIHDAMGRIVRTVLNTNTIDVKDLAPASYVLRVTRPRNSGMIRFVKE